MPNTSSVIDGFKVTLGSMVVQFAMALTVLVLKGTNEIEGSLKEDVEVELWLLAILHVCFAFQIYFNFHGVEVVQIVSQITTIFLMCFQFILVTHLTINWVLPHEDRQGLIKENLQQGEIFVKWCQVEVIVFVGYLFTAMLYMAIAFCKEPIFELMNTATAQSSKADYLEAAFIHVCTVSTFIAPWFTTAILLWLAHQVEIDDENEHEQAVEWAFLLVLLVFQTFCCIIVLLLNFLPYTPSVPFEDWSGYERKICKPILKGAAIHEVCTIILFYVYGFTSMVAFAAFYCFHVNSWIGLYSLFQGCISLGLMPWYDFSIAGCMTELKYQYEDKCDEFLALKEEAQAQRMDAQEATKHVYKNPQHFMIRERYTGKGERKVNTPLYLRKDLYSINFITLIKPVYKMACEGRTLSLGEEAMARVEESRHHRQATYSANVLVLFIMQVGLCVIVLITMSTGEFFQEQPNDLWIVLNRFICGILLHVYLSGEIKQGCDLMKYALNHPWKFVAGGGYIVAWFTGFLQFAMVIIVEIVNYLALTQNSDHIDIVMNFLALTVIANFDDVFYYALSDAEYQKVITDEPYTKQFLMIQTTTSPEAKWILPGNQVLRQRVELLLKKDFPEQNRDNGETIEDRIPNQIFIALSDRSTCNKCLYILYKWFKLFIVAFWYYFSPFAVIILSFIYPKFKAEEHWVTVVAIAAVVVSVSLVGMLLSVCCYQRVWKCELPNQP